MQKKVIQYSESDSLNMKYIYLFQYIGVLQKSGLDIGACPIAPGK